MAAKRSRKPTQVDRDALGSLLAHATNAVNAKQAKPACEGSVIAPAFRERAWCVTCDEPTPSVMCETVRGVTVAFYHYCAECWHKPAANGGPSAAERTGVDAPGHVKPRMDPRHMSDAQLRERLAKAEADRDDYERRWLAECRAHGDTRRKLWAAEHELGDHTHCDDCDAERASAGPDDDDVPF